MSNKHIIFIMCFLLLSGILESYFISGLRDRIEILEKIVCICEDENISDVRKHWCEIGKDLDNLEENK